LPDKLVSSPAFMDDRLPSSSRVLVPFPPNVRSSCLIFDQKMPGPLLVLLLDRFLAGTIRTAACMTTILQPVLAHLAVHTTSPHIIFNNVTSNTRTGLTHFLQFTGPSRTPPRRPAADWRRDYPRDHSDSRSRYRSRDLEEPRQRSSRSPPRRPRHGYRDRDREGYRSRSRSRSYSRSRSRSPRRGRPHYGQESREVMMDGLPVDMAEEDVGQLLPSLFVPLISLVS